MGCSSAGGTHYRRPKGKVPSCWRASGESGKGHPGAKDAPRATVGPQPPGKARHYCTHGPRPPALASNTGLTQFSWIPLFFFFFFSSSLESPLCFWVVSIPGHTLRLPWL